MGNRRDWISPGEKFLRMCFGEDIPRVQDEDTGALRRLHAATEKALDFLDEREREIVEWKFQMLPGMDSGPFPKSLDDISRKFGLGREDVRRIEIEIIQKMRHPQRRALFKEFVGELSEYVSQIVTFEWGQDMLLKDWERLKGNLSERLKFFLQGSFCIADDWRIPTTGQLQRAFSDKVPGFLLAEYLTADETDTDSWLKGVSMHSGASCSVKCNDEGLRLRLVRIAPRKVL